MTHISIIYQEGLFAQELQLENTISYEFLASYESLFLRGQGSIRYSRDEIFSIYPGFKMFFASFILPKITHRPIFIVKSVITLVCLSLYNRFWTTKL